MGSMDVVEVGYLWPDIVMVDCSYDDGSDDNVAENSV